MISISSIQVAFGLSKYELRSIRVASVKNIDWPSCPKLTVKQQQNEAENLLNTLKDLNLINVFFKSDPPPMPHTIRQLSHDR